MPPAAAPAARPKRTGGVQSLERAFAILESMADAGGTSGLSALAQDADLPLPTIHRIVRTLVDLGYVRQQPSRQYTLGPRLIRLGEAASGLLGVWAAPYLAELVEHVGESTNLALLDGDEIVYIAQQPGRHSMRMFTEVGRRACPHCTGVGKALLALRPPAQVRALLERTGMASQTVNTITDPDTFVMAMAAVRADGYAVDEEEQEIGVRCVAVAVPDAPASLALSVSGPAARMTDALVHRTVPLLRDAARRLAQDLLDGRPQLG